MRAVMFLLCLSCWASVAYSNFTSSAILSLGAVEAIGDGSIEVSLVDIQDSRCPKTVNCFVKGQLVAVIDLWLQGEYQGRFSGRLAGHNLQLPRVSLGYKLRIVSAMPYPEEPGDAAEKIRLDVSP